MILEYIYGKNQVYRIEFSRVTIEVQHLVNQYASDFYIVS